MRWIARFSVVNRTAQSSPEANPSRNRRANSALPNPRAPRSYFQGNDDPIRFRVSRAAAPRHDLLRLLRSVEEGRVLLSGGSRKVTAAHHADPPGAERENPLKLRVWIAIAAVGLVALAVVIYRRQRDLAEAERMAVWG